VKARIEMSALRRFTAILVADLRERSRSTRFWIVLAIVGVTTWWCFPSMDAGYVTVAFGDNVRGLYSSAWVGMVLGLLYSTMLSIIGFYLVRGTLLRDFDTRVWQLLVATPMTRSGYLLAKWASHMAVFALIVLVGIAVGGVAQMVRGEDRAFDLIELVKPVIVLAMPALAVTAFFAVLFDMLPWLRRTGGNVLFFFVWLFLFVSAVSIVDPDKVAWARHTWFSDPNGLSLAIRDLESQLAHTAPQVKASGISIGTNAITGKPIVFAWTHWNLRWIDVMGRLLWVGVSMLGVVALAPLLDWAASRMRGTADGAGADPGKRLRWLDPLLRPLESATTGMVLAAELKLVLRQRRGWWWLALFGLGIAQIVGDNEAIGVATIGAWLISVDVFARAILRERESGTGALLFAAAGATRRLLIARIGVALLLAIGTVMPALVHLCVGDTMAALAVLATGAGVALGGLALAVLCRNPRPFELILVMFAYAGVQNAGPLAAVVLPHDALRLEAFLLPACTVILLVLWPRLARVD
jgi:hypothetical protein